MIYAGIDIGGTTIKSGLMDGDSGKLLADMSCPFPHARGVEGTAEDIRRSVDSLCAEIGIPASSLGGIGVCVPGSISPDMSMVLDAYNLGFHNAPLKAEVEKLFPDQTVTLGNDADIAAMAELNNGVFTGHKTAILLTLGTGLGGGIILNGKIFRGGNGNGVEPGHFIVDMHGDLVCTCGSRGCAETLCAATWLVNQGRELVRREPDGLVARYAEGDPDKVNARMVIDCAREKDPVAEKVFDTYLESLATVIASLIALFDPEVIGIGGGVSGAGEFLLAPLRQRVKEKNFFKKEYEIVRAEHGNTAGMIGAATLAKVGY